LRRKARQAAAAAVAEEADRVDRLWATNLPSLPVVLGRQAT